MKVTEIVIENLYGKDYIIPIKDNKLVLVGVNGTCKSTLLYIIHDLLNGTRLSYYKFDKAYVAIDDINYEILASMSHCFSPVNKGKLVYPANYPTMKTMFSNGNHYEIHHTGKRNEKVIPIINKYLSDSDKTADIVDNIIVIKQNDVIIPFVDLSNGEKKIINILTMFYSIEEPIGLIIDDPEMNLSLRWQKDFLQDILDSGNCNLLITATHSPFIYKYLEDYRHDITRLIKNNS